MSVIFFDIPPLTFLPEGTHGRSCIHLSGCRACGCTRKGEGIGGYFPFIFALFPKPGLFLECVCDMTVMEALLLTDRPQEGLAAWLESSFASV